jgi:hypothetical protein
MCIAELVSQASATRNEIEISNFGTYPRTNLLQSADFRFLPPKGERVYREMRTFEKETGNQSCPFEILNTPIWKRHNDRPLSRQSDP